MRLYDFNYDVGTYHSDLSDKEKFCVYDMCPFIPKVAKKKGMSCGKRDFWENINLTN